MISRALLSWRPQGTYLVYWQLFQPTWLFMPLIHAAYMNWADVWQPLRVFGEGKWEHSSSNFPQALLPFHIPTHSWTLLGGLLIQKVSCSPSPWAGTSCCHYYSHPFRILLNHVVLAKLILSLPFQNHICCTQYCGGPNVYVRDDLCIHEDWEYLNR